MSAGCLCARWGSRTAWHVFEDTDSDGELDFLDVHALADDLWVSPPGRPPELDTDGDCAVGVPDLSRSPRSAVGRLTRRNRARRQHVRRDVVGGAGQHAGGGGVVASAARDGCGGDFGLARAAVHEAIAPISLDGYLSTLRRLVRSGAAGADDAALAWSEACLAVGRASDSGEFVW